MTPRCDHDDDERIREILRNIKPEDIRLADQVRIARHLGGRAERLVEQLGGPSKFVATDLTTFSDFFRDAQLDRVRQILKEAIGYEKVQPRGKSA